MAIAKSQKIALSICGKEKEVEEALASKKTVFLPQTNLKLQDLKAVFSIALHMHQPLIPADTSETPPRIISNLEHMTKTGDEYNASVFADCYGRMGSIIPELVNAGKNPRCMLDYSGQLFYGLKVMGREDVLERLRPIATGKHQAYAEWLGTMWGHAVASSTPPPDFKLQMRAWQQEFAALFGFEALARVRGFSPPEMHLPNHPDVAHEYIKTLKECGYKWLLVQEHTIEAFDGGGIKEKHLPHLLVAKNSKGEEASIIAIIKTQGSDTKLVAQMQPYYEAQNLQPKEVGGISIPQIVTQIGDGENGGVMMNEFPSGFRQAVGLFGTTGVVNVNATEYLEMIEAAGVTESALPALRPIHQNIVLNRIKTWEPGAADRAIAEIKKENPGFCMEGGSWTNNISWVRGYEDVLTPMNKLSAEFHAAVDGKSISTENIEYQKALFYLLTSQTSCFRYWGQGAWTEYAKEIIRRGEEALKNLV